MRDLALVMLEEVDGSGDAPTSADLIAETISPKVAIGASGMRHFTFLYKLPSAISLFLQLMP